jgi:Na+-transporting NADH:ubiquinone oxidoreductase subunit C
VTQAPATISAAGPPESDPHRVDGLSGATITGRGVGAALRFWLGEEGFGPYLDRLRKEAGDG